MFSLESPHRGDPNESQYTQYTVFNINIKNYPKLSKICSYGIFSKELKNKFETAMVNESSVFESLKFYCIMRQKDAERKVNSVDPISLHLEQSNLVPRSQKITCSSQLSMDFFPAHKC